MRRRRPPTRYALALVTLLSLVGIGLFVWGPVNPNLVVNTSTGPGSTSDWLGAFFGFSGSSTSGQSVGADGRARTDFTVTNRSFAPVDLVAVRAVAVDWSVGGPGRTPVIVTTSGIPATLGHGERGAVVVTVDAGGACLANHGGTVDYQLLVSARTASGVIRTIGRNDRHSITCSARALPEPGPGPSDPDQARHRVSRAFDTAYRFSAPASQRRSAVDDPSGLDAAVAEVMAGPYAGMAKTSGVHIVEVVFTSPSQAAVLYDLTGVPAPFGTGRIGHARLVDGRWKVTRATVCADLTLAEAHCPPG